MPSRKKQPTGLESGVWLHESGLLGTSPDGLVGDNNDVEAKCPYTQRHLTIEDGDKYLLPEKKKKRDEKTLLKRDHVYWLLATSAGPAVPR